jgi:ATP-dependent helicase/nuclease subunit A
MTQADHRELVETRRETDAAQARAADPAQSVWVSANAGTGKTHVLTNRVLRLLLAGTRPERILCLTYTKAAAAEMSARVFDRLASWVTADDESLAADLARLKRAQATDEEKAHARDLFTVAIETPGGLKVQTIHSFCERLLQRFPLEAQIPPGFTVLDADAGAEIMRRSIDECLAAATRSTNAPLADALRTAIAYAVDDRFDDILREALRHSDWIDTASRIDEGRGPRFAGADDLLRRTFGVRRGITAAGIEAEIAAELSQADLVRIAAVLATGKKSDAELARILSRASEMSADAERAGALAAALLTKDGRPRDRVITKELGEAHPDVADRLAWARRRVHELTCELAALRTIEATSALLRLADAVLQRYTEHKRRRAALDFDDLIRATRRLLASSHAADWVLYKLDGGLDHILVDEAQDTAGPQWDIIRALAGEFFAGRGARAGDARTVFAVGDEKQSIYGFQGAAPELFAEMGRRFAELAKAAAQRWSSIPLTLSFRSAAPVLEAVDRVFAAGPGRVGVAAPGAIVRHVANRIGQAGLVEIWETEKPVEESPREVFRPSSETAPASPVSRLAARIAATIKSWLENGERLASEDRPVRAGDILILVRRRRPFADAMVAALKARGIAVAGADRMRLTEQIAVQDLIVLCDFLLLPEDDLALATVLKSPLFGLDDDALLAIAPGRRGTLWSALLAAAVGDGRFREAAETLKRWRGRADVVPPFELLIEVLDHDGMRARLLRRLGPEAAEPIDELLGLALRHDETAPPSLQGFMHWLRSADREIKRDMEHGRNEVRVMTVHGAKGLEAPIVFLPDTCSTRTGDRPGGLLELDQHRDASGAAALVWPVKGSKDLGPVAAARSASGAREAAERNRLLYVALTRARDRLYIAGFEGRNGRDQNCWYDIVEAALEGRLERHTAPDGSIVRRMGVPQTSPPESRKREAGSLTDALEPPEWAHRRAPREADLTVPLAPSRLAPLDIDQEGEPIAAPPDASAAPPLLPVARGGDAQRFLRGTLTHGLLQHLPRLPRESWQRAAREFVALRGAALTPRARSSIIEETLAVLQHPDFAPLFGPDSRAEVPIVAELAPPDGRGPILRLSGQIDRLVRLDTHVLIVDYKTNRPPPAVAEAVSEAYLLQLAAYRLAAARIFAPRPVRAALLWTDGPRIMEIPSEMLDTAERRLFEAARSRDAVGA